MINFHEKMTIPTIIILRNDHSNDNYGIKWLFLTIITV